MTKIAEAATGIDMTTAAGIDMTTAAGIDMTTAAGIDMTTAETLKIIVKAITDRDPMSECKEGGCT